VGGGREISNINEHLRQNQQLGFRVNTGEDFLSSAVWLNKNNQHAATPMRAAASF
jgi:hypothetical protein